MDDYEFRMLLNLAMISDPWLLSPQDKARLDSLLDRESQSRGYQSWVDAYHNFEPAP